MGFSLQCIIFYFRSGFLNMFQPLSELSSYGLITAFVIFLFCERVSQQVLALVGAGLCRYGLLTAFILFLLQERVPQHVPILVGADLLQSNNSFCNISTSGAGFSKYFGSYRSRPPTFYEQTFVIFLLQERVSTCSDLCRSQPPTVS